MAEFLRFKGDYEGQSEEKAQQKLEMYGENRFFDTEDKSFRPYQILLNPSVVILFITGMIELFALGSVSGAIACFALAIAGAVLLAIYCNVCNESSVKQLSAAKMKYRVIRDSQLKLVPQAMLVPDDIIIVQGGEMVPADAHILEEQGLTVDESRFTGDSAAVKKFSGVDSKATELKASCIYAGSRILTGSVIARVVATGEDAYRSRKSDRKKQPDPNYSHYEQLYSKLRLPIMLTGALISIAVLVFGIISDVEMGIAPNIVKAAALMLCTIPPYVEVLIRLYNIHCAKVCEQKGAAIKNLAVFEKLSGLTALVIDKSAVVAPNMLEVAGIYSKSNSLMTTVTVLACNNENTSLTEQAFLLNAQLGGTDVAALRANPLVARFDYAESERIGGNIYQIEGQYLLCVKGAVEKILSLCDLSAEKITSVQNRAASLARKGYEVWASAYVIYENEEDLPKTLYNVKYTYMGLVSFISATRDMIPLAVQSCKKAGVKLIMTTSDSPETAAAMGRKIGLKSDCMISGDDIRIAQQTGESLNFCAAEIFCSITGEQKLVILDNLKAQGEIVAALGHGDADYEVLCRSDLGMTSLEKTAGCVYEASGLIIREDNFAVIVDIMKEARQLHRNIKKCISMCITAFTAIFLTALTDIIFGTGVITPTFSALLALFVVPLCASCYIGCTADIKTDMTSSRFTGHGKLSKRFFAAALIPGLVIGAVSAVVSYIFGGLMPPMQTSAGVFIMLAVAFCSFTVCLVSRKIPLIPILKHGAVKRRAVTALALTATASVLITCIPFVNTAFGFEAPHPVAFAAAVFIGAVPAAVKEILKSI